jgi:hypothetical protein
MKTHRFRTAAGIVLLAATALGLAGCSSPGAGDETPAADANGGSGDTAIVAGDCAGVRVVVDPGELEGADVDTCVETDAPITAVKAFEAADVELVGVSTSDAFFACRVAGAPAADEALEYEGESYTSGDCADFGPIWAWWGLFEDSGSGWEFAQEGADTLELAPGDAVAFAFQLGDTAEPRLPGK